MYGRKPSGYTARTTSSLAGAAQRRVRVRLAHPVAREAVNLEGVGKRLAQIGDEAAVLQVALVGKAPEVAICRCLACVEARAGHSAGCVQTDARAIARGQRLQRAGRRDAEVELARFGKRAIGALVVAVIAREIDEAVVAQRETSTERQIVRIAAAVVRGTAAHRRVQRSVFTQQDIDHARDGIRAVLRGCTVAQDLDAPDRRGGNLVVIGGRGALADGAAGVHPGGAVQSLAIDQHERLVRRESAQRSGVDMRVAVGRGGCRERKRGRLLFEDLTRFLVARCAQLRAAQRIDGNG